MSEVLQKKTLTELRQIAQSFGVLDIFKKDGNKLIQDIELKQKNLIPEKLPEVVKPEYDARLMQRPPAKKTDEEMLRDYGKPYEARGIKISYDQERWYASIGKKNDEGTMRMPPRTFIRCLDRLLD